MTRIFVLSYVLLVTLILLETVVLRVILRKTMWFQRFYAGSNPANLNQNDLLMSETSTPQFSLPALQTGKMVTTANLIGHRTLLCFVSPQPTPLHRTLKAALHAWWHKMEGRVYIVCTGSEPACRELVGESAKGFPLERTIVDEAGILAQRFLIVNTPQAVELDENGQVKRVGSPESVELQIVDSNDGAADNVEGSHHWPDDRKMTGAGFARVDTPISCVLSRFHLKSPLSLLPFYLAFRRIRRDARDDVPGLLKAVFLIEGIRTCYTLSIWKNDWSIVEFGRVRAHIDAANSVFRVVSRKDPNHAEIWSAQFRLWAVSSHNLSWDGLDMEEALGRTVTRTM
jgi:hypothetical protein